MIALDGLGFSRLKTIPESQASDSENASPERAKATWIRHATCIWLMSGGLSSSLPSHELKCG